MSQLKNPGLASGVEEVTRFIGLLANKYILAKARVVEIFCTEFKKNQGAWGKEHPKLLCYYVTATLRKNACAYESDIQRLCFFKPQQEEPDMTPATTSSIINPT